MRAVIDEQIRTLDWAALDRAIGLSLPRSNGKSGEDLCVEASDYLEELGEQLHKLPLSDAVLFRLLCQLAFSVLLEADKAFLAIPEKDRLKYLAPRRAVLPPALVENFLASKPAAVINPLRGAARKEMFAGLAKCGGRRIQTMTLPTGTGKTLLAASWRCRCENGSLRKKGNHLLS